MSAPRDPHANDPLGRTEPTLGDLGQLDTLTTTPGQRTRRAPSPPAPATRATPADAPARRRWLLPAVLGAVIVALLTLWIGRGWLVGMVPRTDFNDVLSRAQAALQQGHLDGDDGSSARELFQAAVALQPDSDAAHDGLHQVGMAEVAQADAALQAGQLDLAAQKAAIARELLGGGSDVDHLDRAIAARRNANVPAATLLQQAQQAFAAGQLSGETGAGALYRKLLAAEPGNAVARHGLDQVGDALASQAQQALAANDGKAADAAIDQLAALQPNNAALPGLRAARAQARQQDSAALDDALQQGEAALRAGRIDGAGDDTALAHFQAALALDPNNPQAQAGLGKVAQALTVQASAAMDADDPAQAATLLGHAAALAPKSADLAAAQARLQAMQHAQASAAASPATPTASPAPAGDAGLLHPTLTPQQSARIAKLLQQAQAAAQRGDIMLPPGQCAYDLYRNVLVIDGNNAAAQSGLQSLPGVVQKRYAQALAAGQLNQAGAMLQNLADLAPGDPAQAVLRQRLAGAWLDRAEQQLAQGNHAAAAQALEQARKLAPNQARLQDLAARLQAGHG